MVDIKSFREIALSFPDTVELPHFEKTSFRVKNKIFATLSENEHLACIRLSEIDQSVFCSHDHEIIFPVGNKWGKQGWTYINLKKVRRDLVTDALRIAHHHVSSKK